MKKACLLIAIQCIAALSFNPVHAQAEEAQQLLLDVEKLVQLKQILQDLKTGYEIIRSGYNTIKDISEGNFKLHQQYLNSLMEVSPAVRKYKRIKDIISLQLQLVKEYKAAYRNSKVSNQFEQKELKYISSIYNNLLQQSLKNLNVLGMVLTAGTLRMSDGERLQAIDQIFENMLEQLSFLRQFNSHNEVLALQRIKERNEILTIENFYGITR